MGRGVARYIHGYPYRIAVLFLTQLGYRVGYHELGIGIGGDWWMVAHVTDLPHGRPRRRCRGRGSL